MKEINKKIIISNYKITFPPITTKKYKELILKPVGDIISNDKLIFIKKRNYLEIETIIDNTGNYFVIEIDLLINLLQNL